MGLTMHVKSLVTRTGLLLTLGLFSPLGYANEIPDGMMFIGLNEQGWSFYTSKGDAVTAVEAIEHPRAGTYHPTLNRIAYVGSDNVFVEHDLETGERIPVSSSGADNSRYAQPRYSQDGRMLLAVELPDGRSRRTNIIGIDTSTRQRYQFVRKRTAQFEPQMMTDEYLYYTTAICVDDCEGMIWELWRRNMQTARQEQLTLMNAVARQPHLGYDNWLYFSSNAVSGHFNIWKMKAEVGSPPVQLTFGSERDSSPATDRDGNVYFIRKSPSATQVMKLTDGEPVELALPHSVLDIRHLEVIQ